MGRAKTIRQYSNTMKSSGAKIRVLGSLKSMSGMGNPRRKANIIPTVTRI